MEILGVDIGGSGIKGAPVNTQTGELLSPRYRIPTPQPSKPRPVAKTVDKIASHFSWHGPIGAGFPAPILGGKTMMAANVHKKWEGFDAKDLLENVTGCPVCLINDADAAGLAEMTFGAGRERKGVVIIITIGTGLGSSLFTDGYLFPNAELGHLQIDGKDAEWRASDAARKRERLSWKKWAKRFDRYLKELDKLFWPDLYILGGGISKKHQNFIPLLTTRTEVVPAQLLNEAGIVGAALASEHLMCMH